MYQWLKADYYMVVRKHSNQQINNTKATIMLTKKSNWNGKSKVEQRQSKQHNPTQKSTDIQHKNYYTIGNTTYMLEQRQQKQKHNNQNNEKMFMR